MINQQQEDQQDDNQQQDNSEVKQQIISQNQNLPKCQFKLRGKTRPCNQPPIKDSLNCIFHSGHIEKMINCPLDPKHTVDKSKLEKHLKICPFAVKKQKTEQQIWFSKEINKVGTNTTSSINIDQNQNHEKQQQEQTLEKSQEQNQTDKSSLNALKQITIQHPDKIKEILEKLPSCLDKAIELYHEYLQTINDKQFESFSDLKQYILDIDEENDINNGQFSKKQRHLVQGDILTDVLDKYRLLNKHYCYIEFGAGKGGLSSDICQKIKSPESIHILLEREKRKFVYDKKHQENPFYLRFTTDIMDFNVNKLPLILDQTAELKQTSKINIEHTQNIKVVGVSKHMCGMATDLTLKTLLNCDPNQKVFFQGMMIATCCHHLCNKQSYINIDFLKEIGFADVDLDILFKCSAWFNQGRIRQSLFKKKEEKIRQKQQEQEQNSNQQQQTQEQQNEQSQQQQQQQNQSQSIKKQEQEEVKSQNIAQKFEEKCIEQHSLDQNNNNNSEDKKEMFGYMIKRIIDIGRILLLQKNGQKIRLYKYCDKSVSPENFVIVSF